MQIVPIGNFAGSHVNTDDITAQKYANTILIASPLATWFPH